MVRNMSLQEQITARFQHYLKTFQKISQIQPKGLCFWNAASGTEGCVDSAFIFIVVLSCPVVPRGCDQVFCISQVMNLIIHHTVSAGFKVCPLILKLAHTMSKLAPISSSFAVIFLQMREEIAESHRLFIIWEEILWYLENCLNCL